MKRIILSITMALALAIGAQGADDKPMTYDVPLYKNHKTTLEIRIPKAYVILPQYGNLTELLELHGLKYDVLDSPAQMQVENPKIRAEFEEKMKDKAFADSPDAILNYFYEICRKQSHQDNELHPVFRVMD